MYIELFGQFGQRLLALDSGQSHLRLEGRAMVPAWSLRHALSCSRQPTPRSGRISTYPACSDFPSQLSTFLHWSSRVLLINLFLAMPVEAPNSTYRASALRINGLHGVIVDEPVIANAPDNPCKSDGPNTLASLLIRGVLVADVLSASTILTPEPAEGPATAEGKADAVELLAGGLIATGLDATARVDSFHGLCRLASKSSVASATVLRPGVTPGGSHLDVPVPGVGIVHFNESLGGRHPTSGKANFSKVIQRALWIQITNPSLQAEG